MEELILKLHRLNELEESFRDSLSQTQEADNSLKQAVKYLVEWVEVKKQIRLLTFDRSILSIPDSENREIRTILQKISLGEKLPLENIFSGTELEKIFETNLEYDEIEHLESDLFYSWFSGYDYVKELYSVGSLIVSVGDLPSSLLKFVDELRSCFVFQRYLSVYSLCRAVLEIAMNDLFNKNGLDNKASQNYQQVKKSIVESEKNLPKNKKFQFPRKAPTLYQSIKMLTTMDSYTHLEATLNDIREKTNPLAHGDIGNHITRPLEIIRITLQSIHDLYEVKLETSA